MVMKSPEAGLDSPSEPCTCLTQPQYSTKITRMLKTVIHDDTKLQQDVKEFRNSFLMFLQSCQDEYQKCLSEVMAAVQRAQLNSIEALQACQSEATHLQLCLQELNSRYHLEQQRRRALHNSLVVSACIAITVDQKLGTY
ncbi:Kinesin KIF25 [Sigmodon hispidus]